MKNDAEREKEVVNRLIGAWHLVTWFEIKANGDRVYPLGEDAIGQIIYSADGHVAAQLMARKRKRFRSDDWREASERASLETIFRLFRSF